MIEGVGDNIIDLNMAITSKNGVPCIEIRRFFSDPEILKIIVAAALYDRPIIAFPSCKNKIRAINSLIKNGILYKKGEELVFNI